MTLEHNGTTLILALLWQRQTDLLSEGDIVKSQKKTKIYFYFFRIRVSLMTLNFDFHSGLLSYAVHKQTIMNWFIGLERWLSS